LKLVDVSVREDNTQLVHFLCFKCETKEIEIVYIYKQIRCGEMIATVVYIYKQIRCGEMIATVAYCMVHPFDRYGIEAVYASDTSKGKR
jgi:hypothetical protein